MSVDPRHARRRRTPRGLDVVSLLVAAPFAARGLDKRTLRNAADGKQRLRWEASHPGALWHGDVCVTAPICSSAARRNLRASTACSTTRPRDVVALEAMHQEREVDMLGLLRACHTQTRPTRRDLPRQRARPTAVTPSCSRLRADGDYPLARKSPYDAPARGKMERFWRTLRERCSDFAGTLGSPPMISTSASTLPRRALPPHPPRGLMRVKPPRLCSRAAARPGRLRRKETPRCPHRPRSPARASTDSTVLHGRRDDWETDLWGFSPEGSSPSPDAWSIPPSRRGSSTRGVRHVLQPVRSA